MFYGWIIVGLSFALVALAYVVWYSFAVFFVPLLAAFGWPRAETAGAFSLFVLLHGLVGISVGSLTDRFGPRAVMASGAIVLVAALVGCSQIVELWQLYLFFGFGCALGVAGIGWVPNVTLVQRWFRQRLGLAMGLAASGTGAGILASGPLVQTVINAAGWRSAYLALAMAALVVPAVALLFVRDQPADMGLQPDGRVVADVKGENRDDLRVVDRIWASRTWDLASAIRTWRFWLLFVSFAGGGYLMGTVFVHQVALLTDVGYERMLVASVVGLMGVVSLGGKIAWGVASDWLGRELAYLFGVGLMLVGLVLLGLADRVVAPWYAVVYGVVFALGYAVVAVISPTTTAEVFGGKSFGALYGALYLGTGLGNASGAWGTGLIFDRMGNYHVALALAGAVGVLAIACLWMAAPRQIRLAPGVALRRTKGDD